jgi:ERCC4-type nuclease
MLLFDHGERRSGVPDLAHFGSLERVFAARHDELLAVRGTGPVRARTLDRLFRTTTPDQPVRSLAA